MTSTELARDPARAAGPGRLPSRRVKILLAFAAVYLIWGSTYLGIRIAIETIPPLFMAGVRYALAGALLLAWTLARNAERPSLSHWRSATIIGALLIVGGNGAVSWSELRVPTGIAALVIAAVPLWMALLDWIRPGGVRPSARVFSGLALGITGLWFLVGPGSGVLGQRPDPVGVAVLIVGALAWSMGSLRSRRAPLPKSPLLGIAMEMFCGGVLLVGLALLVGEGPRIHLGSVSFRSLLAFLYLVTIGSLIGFTCYVWLLRVSTPAKVSTYAFVNPIVAILIGWWLGGEALTPRMLISATVIVAAVAIITTAPVARPDS